MMFKGLALVALLITAGLVPAQAGDWDEDRCAELSDTQVYNRYVSGGSMVKLCAKCNTGKYLQWLHEDGGVCRDEPSGDLTVDTDAGSVVVSQGPKPQNNMVCAKTGWDTSGSSCPGLHDDCIFNDVFYLSKIDPADEDNFVCSNFAFSLFKGAFDTGTLPHSITWNGKAMVICKTYKKSTCSKNDSYDSDCTGSSCEPKYSCTSAKQVACVNICDGMGLNCDASHCDDSFCQPVAVIS